MNQTFTPRLLDGEVLHELLLLRRGELRELHLDGAVHADRRQALLRQRGQQGHSFGDVARLAFVQVQDHELRLQRQEGEARQGAPLLLRQGELPQGALLHQVVLEGVQKLPLRVLGGRGLALCRLLVKAREAVADDAQVAVDELRFHDLPVAQGVDGLLRVGDGGVAKGPHDVQQRLGLRDEGEKGVAQPGALAGVAGQARQVHELDGCRRFLFRFEHLSQLVEARVRHADQGPVRLGPAARVGFDLRSGARDDVEHRRFARERQADDSTFQQKDPLQKSTQKPTKRRHKI